MEYGHRGSASLNEACDQLRVLLRGPSNPRARHAIGALVCKVKSAPAIYGDGGVAKLAATTGEDVPTLYRYANVAACWSVDEVLALVADDAPRPLSWSHLVLIAAVECVAERREWLAKCRSEKLSVRELENRLLRAPGPQHEVLARFERALRAAERVLTEAARLDDAAVEHLPPQYLERAIAVHERMRKFAEQRLEILRRRGSRTGRSGSYERVDPGGSPASQRRRRNSQR